MLYAACLFPVSWMLSPSIWMVECAPRSDNLPWRERVVWILVSWWPGSQRPYTACTSIWCICSTFAAICSPMYIHFLVFWTPRGPSRTPKNHENHCTVIQIQCFANLKKIPFWDRLCMPSGPLWGPFWSPLRSLGLLLALPGLPKRFKNSKKMNKMRSWTALGAPRVQKDAKDSPGPPKWTLKTSNKYEK